jgi:restriction system protein
MGVPTYDKFVEPILRYLSRNPAGAPAKDAHAAAADALAVSEADRQLLLPSGTQLIYKNRSNWAHDRLKRAALSSSPRRGYWQITKQGLDFIRAHPSPFTPAEVEQLATGFLDVRLRPDQPTASAVEEAPVEVSANSGLASPDDRLGEAVAELRKSVSRELLEILGTASPTFFETVVLDLLHRMGYGASKSDLQRVGGSGDGGIDGVISLDKL